MLGKDLKEYAGLILIGFISAQWVLSNYVDLIGNEALTTRLYFLSSSLSVLLVLVVYLPKKWYVWAFIEMAIYWVIDEIRNEGDIYHWYELPLMTLILGTNYLYAKFKHDRD